MTSQERGFQDFADFAANLKSDEKSEAQTFLFHLLEAFNHDANTLPLTTAKLRRALDAQKFAHGGLVAKPAPVLSNDGVLRNVCILGESVDDFCIASVDEMKGSQCALTVSVLSQHPFANFECKRVGVEEGMKKGPQSIEKAKQGRMSRGRFRRCKKSDIPTGKLAA